MCDGQRRGSIKSECIRPSLVPDTFDYLSLTEMEPPTADPQRFSTQSRRSAKTMKSSVATIYEGFVGKHPTNNALFDELWGAGAERVGFDYPYSGARVAPAAAPKVADGRLLSAMVGMFQQLCELALGRPRGRYNNGYEPCVNPEEYGFPKELLRAILPGLELLETLIFGVHSYLGAEGGGEQLPYAGASRTHGAAVSATGALSEVAAALARLVGADGCSVYVAAASGGSAQPVCIGTHCEDGCSPGLGEQAPAPVYWTLRDAAAWQEGGRLCVPLLGDGTFHGAVYCWRQDNGAFRDDDMELLLLCVPLCSPAVSTHARHLLQLGWAGHGSIGSRSDIMLAMRSQKSESSSPGAGPLPERGQLGDQATARIFQSLASGDHTLEKLLSKVSHEVIRSLHCNWSATFLADEKTGEVSEKPFVFRQMINGENNQARVSEKSFGESRVYMRGAPGSSGGMFKQSQNGTRLTVKIVGKDGKLLGIQWAGDPVGGSFTYHDEVVLRELGAVTAYLIANARAIHRLRLVENHFEAIFDSMATGVIIIDFEGRISKANRAAGRILMRDAFDLQGSAISHALGDDGDVDAAVRNAMHNSSTESLLDHTLSLRQNEAESKTKALHLNITVTPMMHLERVLKAFEKRKTLMFGRGKTLLDLQAEINQGVSQLSFESHVLRSVCLLVLRVVSPDGWVLVQQSRMRQDLKEEFMDLRLPAVKLLPSESGIDAARRCLDRLPRELTQFVIQVIDTQETAVETKESASFVGLYTEYTKMFYEAQLSEYHAHEDEMLVQFEGWNFTYRWVREQDLEEIGLLVRGECQSRRAPKTKKQNQLLGAIMVIEDITTEMVMMRVMTRYMDKKVAKELLSKGESAGLGGKLVDATVLFCDLRSFTACSEGLGPTETVSMLNEYFQEMVTCITMHGGIVDKFIGDAIMAVWGTPFQSPGDADRAVEASLSMLDRLEILNKVRANRGQFPLKIGIGINSGTMVSGNIGSEHRMEYTVIGDAVNMGSRLEGATKEYGISVLISENTRQKLQSNISLREIDVIVVKGKTKPQAVWEPLASNMVGCRGIDLFTDALQRYREADFSGAAKVFQAAIEVMPEDGPSKVYLERCRELMQSPPENWDGVWHMTNK